MLEKIVVLAFVLLLCGKSSAKVDGTLMRDRNGSSVVRAVIAKINASCTDIFSEPRLCQSNVRSLIMIFLRQMAYVETRDGYSRTQGGIWNMPRNTFNNIQHYSCVSNYDLIGKVIQNSKILNVNDWCTIMYAKLSVPIYSGLVAALRVNQLINMRSNDCDSPTSSDQLFKLWNCVFGRHPSDNMYKRQWRDRVGKLIGNESKPIAV